MKTEWDYTRLADTYIKCPNYAQNAIDKMGSMHLYADNTYAKEAC